MITIKHIRELRTALAVVIAFFGAVMTHAQFLTPAIDSPVTQSPIEDVRTGSVGVSYDMSSGHMAGHQYRWEVTGGTITSVNGSGIITGGNAVEFAVDATTITVDWDQSSPGSIAPAQAYVRVQKIVESCPSQVVTLPINVWSLPTANISNEDVEMCSGEATPGRITVNLTGAPDDGDDDGFSVSYEIVSTDITDGDGNDLNGTTGTVESNGSSVSIPLPARLINASSSEDRTFAVNLTGMIDDFDDQSGSWTDGTFVITVHPEPLTGPVMSTYSVGAQSEDYIAIACTGDTATYYVQGTVGSSYSWSVDGGTIINDYNDSIHVHWGDEPGEFDVRVQETTVFGCSGIPVTGTVMISAPEINMGDDTFICEGDSVTIRPEGDFVSFEWMDGSFSTTLTVFEEGTVSLTAFDVYGCPARGEVYIEVKPRPEVDLGENTSICDFEPLSLDAGPEGVNYTWSTGETTRRIDVFQGYKEIWVLVEDEFGCVNTDTIIIEACLFDGLFDDIPTAITPSNQDGKNDVWNIQQLQSFPDAIVDIYDRWGRLIWRSEPGYPTPWDGRDMSGREVPMDSYHFVILLNFADNERITGTITVIR